MPKRIDCVTAKLAIPALNRSGSHQAAVLSELVIKGRCVAEASLGCYLRWAMCAGRALKESLHVIARPLRALAGACIGREHFNGPGTCFWAGKGSSPEWGEHVPTQDICCFGPSSSAFASSDLNRVHAMRFALLEADLRAVLCRRRPLARRCPSRTICQKANKERAFEGEVLAAAKNARKDALPVGHKSALSGERLMVSVVWKVEPMDMLHAAAARTRSIFLALQQH
jgi:hypothetical protein